MAEKLLKALYYFSYDKEDEIYEREFTFKPLEQWGVLSWKSFMRNYIIKTDLTW